MKRIWLSIVSISLYITSVLSFAAQEYDVVIIGAGVAGLTCAEKLNKKNKNLVILEAKDRLGGRVHSDYSWGFSLDLGASWVHGIDNNPLTKLMGSRRLLANNYSSDNPSGMLSDFALYDKQGMPVREAQRHAFVRLTKEFIEYTRTNDQKQSFQKSFDEFSKQKDLSSRDKELLHYALENIYNYEFAENLIRVAPNSESVYNLSQAKGVNALLPEGYFKLFENFATDVPKHFKQIVKTINYTSGGVDIITQNKKYHAKKVVITVPLGVLKAGKINFIPALPAKKRAAIDGLAMGNYEKLYLQFDQIFWDKDKEWIGKLPRERKNAFNIFNYAKYTNQPILIAFTSGQLAREMEKKGGLKQWVMQRLQLIYGKNIPEPIRVKQTHWGSDPYTLGSYSYLPANKEASLYQDMAEPVAGKLYFAGEATSTTDPSTVLGAYLSGKRAAKQVGIGLD